MAVMAPITPPLRSRMSRLRRGCTALPLAQLAARRVDNVYDLMDSAYGAAEIRA